MTASTGEPDVPVSVEVADEAQVVAALRRGDEAAFVQLVERYHAPMVRLALLYSPNRAVAEDIAQEAWEGVVRGLHRFEGRSSLRTWIFRILTNCAKSRAVREGRSIPFSSAWSSEDNVDDPAVDPSRFRASDPWRDHWTSLPQNWDALPEDRLLARDTLACVRQAMDALPAGQRTVIALRDVEGWSADEVCNVLNISETNQRVLLHRARSKVRRALETYFDLGERA